MSQLTWTGWYFLKNITGAMLFSKPGIYWTHFFYAGIGIRLYGNLSTFKIDDAGRPPFLNVWEMLTIVYDGVNLKLYQNDDLTFRTTTSLGYVVNNDDRPYIGDYRLTPPRYPFYGIIDTIKVYNRALNDIEVSQLYHQKPYWNDNDPIISNGLLAFWENSGNNNDNWQDLSGNGNHGTVYGSPESCLVHRRGHVIRGNPPNRYIVR